MIERERVERAYGRDRVERERVVKEHMREIKRMKERDIYRESESL